MAKKPSLIEPGEAYLNVLDRIVRQCGGLEAAHKAIVETRDQWTWRGEGWTRHDNLADWASRKLNEKRREAADRERRQLDRKERFVKAALSILRSEPKLADKFSDDLRAIADEADPPDPATLSDVIEGHLKYAQEMVLRGDVGRGNDLLVAIDKLDRFLEAERIILD